MGAERNSLKTMDFSPWFSGIKHFLANSTILRRYLEPVVHSPLEL